MIEVKSYLVDGTEFNQIHRILEPDERIGRVGVHRLPSSLESRTPEIVRLLKLAGIKKVKYDAYRNQDLYAESVLPYAYIKTFLFILKAYWWTIRFLYNNACMFRRKPAFETFTWKSFTPYCWYQNIKSLKKR